MNNLTDKTFWERYWKKKQIVKKVGENYPFSDLFKMVLSKKVGGKMIEVGGFPGYMAIYFAKYWGYKTTLLDYVVQRKILNNIYNKNNIASDEIEVLEANFFTYKTAKKYDLVLSIGFIEHFDNTQEVIERHWKLVDKGGEMLVILPNFLGLNGLTQLLFDPDNLNKHNLESMDTNRLRQYLVDLGIKKNKVFYWGGMQVWLEDFDTRPLYQKAFVGIVYVLGKIIKKLGINNKFMSPYIVVYAKKQ